MPGERSVRAAAAYALVVTVLVVGATRADRYPLPRAAVAIALFAPPLGAGLLGRSWRLLALVPLPAVLGFAFAFASDNWWLPIVYGAMLAGAALLLLPVGVAIGRRVTHPTLPGIAGAVVAAGLLIIPIAVLARHRTVTVERPHPLPIDERAGTFRGVGLDDLLQAVRRRLGSGERLPPDDPRWGGVGPDVTTGPSSLPGSYDKLRYGRDLAFLLDDQGRVALVMIADRRAQTRAGVGPGDSLERFRSAYPGIRCEEGSVGGDQPIPYPFCRVRVGDHRWLFVYATYDRPGEPAVVLILSIGPAP